MTTNNRELRLIPFTDATGVRIPVGTPLPTRLSAELVKLCKREKFQGL